MNLKDEMRWVWTTELDRAGGKSKTCVIPVEALRARLLELLDGYNPTQTQMDAGAVLAYGKLLAELEGL